MTRTSRVAAVGLALLMIALVAWARCSGTSPEHGPVDVAPTPERAPPKVSSPPRRASDTPPMEPSTAPVDPATSKPAATAAKSDAPAAPPREIVLYVTDEGGAPVAGLWACIDKHAMGEQDTGRTDDSGRCRFVAAGGPRHINVAEKIVPRRAFLPVGDVVVAATQTEVRLRLREGAAIEGRVVDEREEPVVSVNVAVLGPDGFTNAMTIDANGEFRLPAPVGSRCDLRLGVQTTNLFMPDEDYDGSLDGVAAGTTGVVLRCRRVTKDRALSVLVVDPSGAPRPRAYVTLSVGGFLAPYNADKDGRCRFENLPARELTAHASTLYDAPEDLYAPALPVKVVPDGQEIVLQLRRANLVKIAFVDAAGAAVAVAGMEIAAKRGTRRILSCFSNASGRTTLKVPPEEIGTIRVEVRAVYANGAGEPLGTADVDVPTDREIRIVVAR